MGDLGGGTTPGKGSAASELGLLLPPPIYQRVGLQEEVSSARVCLNNSVLSETLLTSTPSFPRTNLDNSKVISILLPICTRWKQGGHEAETIPNSPPVPAPPLPASAASIAHKPGGSTHPSIRPSMHPSIHPLLPPIHTHPEVTFPIPFSSPTYVLLLLWVCSLLGALRFPFQASRCKFESSPCSPSLCCYPQ